MGPRLIPASGADVVYSLADYWPIKKLIDVGFVQFRPVLKALTAVESLCCSRLLHQLMTRSEKI